MLRQLWRLSRTVEVEGRRMCAPAVYAERRGHEWRIEHASQMGYEGVACVDDASRLAILLLRAYERHKLGWALEWAERNLDFVLYMQQPDGSFANFILDWDGEPNLEGPTSRPVGLPWLVRAMWALATAYRITGEPRYRERYFAALDALPEDAPYADLLAIAVLAALEMHAAPLDAEPTREVGSSIEGWCEDILSCERGGVLLNHLDEPSPHLWAFIQPGALALASKALKRPEWLGPAEGTVRRYLGSVARGGFESPRALPYEVSSTVFNFDALYSATGDVLYRDLAASARAWFHGRNTASQQVYDREKGMVFDGTDGDRVSLNSGAESNIEGAFALFDELPWWEYSLA